MMHVGNAQNLSKQDLLADLQFLNDAVINGHGINYDYSYQSALPQFIDSIAHTSEDSIDAIGYYLAIAATNYKIGCGHTYVQKVPILKGINTKSYFPLQVHFFDTTLFVIDQTDSSLEHYTGQQILSINGISPAILFNTLKTFRPSDGGSDAFGKAVLNLHHAWLIALYFRFPKEFSIQFKDSTVVLSSIDKPQVPKKLPEPDSVICKSRDGDYLQKLDIQTAYLKMTHFDNLDVYFLQEAFAHLKTENYQYLILDLRFNPGGARNTGAALMQCLADTIFDYTIVRPELNPTEYLSYQGKLAHVSSYMRYNLYDFRHTQFLNNKPSGFKYVYKPADSSLLFTGKVFVLTDGFTSSTSTMVTSWLKLQNRATFIGTQSGGGYNGNNGGSFPTLKLPKSKIEIKFPTYHLILDENSTNEQGIIPEYSITYSLEDVLQGKDLELEKALALIAKEKAATLAHGGSD